MTPEQAGAFVIAMAACATIECEAMKRRNKDWDAGMYDPGGPLPYGVDDFRAVADRFGIGHNTVLQLFQDVNR